MRNGIDLIDLRHSMMITWWWEVILGEAFSHPTLILNLGDASHFDNEEQI